ncbi:potassium channel family protein [Endothiovibrio diazotrophicus]
MKIVFIGSGDLAVLTARALIGRGHEVVLIERRKSAVEELAGELDCAILHGDGARPSVLKEVAPPSVDLLFCLTDDDQTNIIASLVAHSLGFRKVVTQIQDPELEHVADHLGLADAMVPMRTVSRFLADMAEGGEDAITLSTLFRDEARLFSFHAGAAEAGEAAGLDLPENARAICVYHEGRFAVIDGTTPIREGDEVVILTDVKHLRALRQRFPQ